MSDYWSELIASGRPLTAEQQQAFARAARLVRTHINESLRRSKPWTTPEQFDYDRHLQQLQYDFLDGTRTPSLERDVAQVSYHWLLHVAHRAQRVMGTVAARG